MVQGNTDLIDAFDGFFRNYYRDEIGELAQGYPVEEKSLHVDWRELYRFDPDLADDVLNQPAQILEYAEEALRLYELPVDVSLSQAHLRVRNLPDSIAISDIRADQRGKLIAVEGVVREMTGVSPKVTNAAFECQRCGTLTRIPQGSEEYQEPHECQGCERKGPFRINFDQSEFIDAEKLRIQELPGNYEENDPPQKIDVTVEDDLAGNVSIGDRVTITGTLKLDQRGTARNESVRYDVYIEGLDIEDTYSPYPEVSLDSGNEQRIKQLAENDDLFEQFVQSLAPSVDGYELLKEAVILQLFGGVTKEFPDGGTSRGNIHTLVVSDPGNAVSRLIDRSRRFAPRAVSISGTTTSEAAMTAPATTSSNAPGGDPWEIKAGITVMADQGLLVIDDLEGLDDGGRSALASVLDSQEVKVSKATQKKTYPARASVLAAGKPKYERFDEFEPIAEQLGLGPGLVTNFDLVFTYADVPGEDEGVASHVLDVTQAVEHSKDSDGIVEDGDVEPTQDLEEYEPKIPDEDVRKFVVYARNNCYPTLTESAKQKIKDFYTTARRRAGENDSAMPVSVEKLESIVRLVEASARTRLSPVVEERDVERVKRIVESNLEGLGVNLSEDGFDADVIDGSSNSDKKDLLENVRELITGIEAEFDEGAPVDIIIEEAADHGISEDRTLAVIDKLKARGELYEPSTDHLRTT